MAPSLRHERVTELLRRLAELTAEVSRTEDELASLECDGRLVLREFPSTAKIPRTPAEKITLFLDLFGTRRSVYPKRWESTKTGKSGYRIELPQTGASIWFGSETDEANNAGNNVCVIASVPMAALQSPKP